MDFKTQIDRAKLPRHIAIIMDGNGRWAKKHGQPRVFGHRQGVKSVRQVVEAASEIGIGYITLYTFSTENWSRPKYEVTALMSLLVDTIYAEVDTLHKNNVRLQTIGDIAALPARSYRAMLDGIEKTKNNSGLTLVLALNYSAKWEILRAVNTIAAEAAAGIHQPGALDEATFSNLLSTQGIPDPELLIRTSGEHRLSNFLLWQLAYAEFYFTDVLWPDFGKGEFFEAIFNYQNRERRFGKTSEQVSDG